MFSSRRAGGWTWLGIDPAKHWATMSGLAQRTNATLPRLSHVVRRLEDRGFVERRACPGDGRATNATLTDAGWDKIVASAPGHVEHVRRTVFDALSPEQVSQLDEISAAILAHLDPEGRMSPRLPARA